MSLNKILLIGNVGADPQVRSFGDSKVASFSLATTEKRRDKDGNVVQETEWHNVVVWRNAAEVVEKYVRKGTQLYIEGKIKTEKYEDSAGVTKYAVKVYATTLQLLGGADRQQAQPEQQRPAQPEQSRYGQQRERYMEDDDLPAGDGMPF